MRDWPREPPVPRDEQPRVAERPGERAARRSAAVPSQGAHPLARVAKVAVAMASVLVFGTTWYGWAQVHDPAAGLSTVDVIDPAAPSPPGGQNMGGENIDAQNILLVGLDTRTDAQGNPLPAAVLNQLHAGTGNDGGDATDTMIVIHIPAGGGQVTAISIPRDSYVPLASGFGQHKINSAFTYGKAAAQQQLRTQGVTGARLATLSDQAGAKTTIQTVEQFTGLTINHYAGVNLAGFYFISQAVGGIPVCLKAPVHDSYSGANFPAGPQIVSGSQALALVRQRHGLPHGDLDRIIRQQAFMASMANTVLSSGTLTDPTKLTNLISAIKKTTVIDNGWDIMSFAQELQGISARDIHFVTIPIVNINLLTPSDGDAVEVDPQQVQAFIQQQINDHTDVSATPTSPAPTPSPAVAVTVFHVRDTSGLARKIVDTLAAQGFITSPFLTATTRNTTVIDYAPDDEAVANRVVSALGGRLRLVPDPLLTAGQVRIYLGKDFANSTLRIVAPTARYRDNSPAQQRLAAADPITTATSTCIN